MSAATPAMPGGKNGGNHSVALVGAAGGSFAVVLAALVAKPELVFDMARSFGPVFVVALAVLVVMDRWVGRGVEAFRENTDVQRQTAVAIAKGAAANESLSAAVQRIASKDDERAREQDLVLGHLARNSSEILRRLSAIEDRMDNGNALSAHGGA